MSKCAWKYWCNVLYFVVTRMLGDTHLHARHSTKHNIYCRCFAWTLGNDLAWNSELRSRRCRACWRLADACRWVERYQRCLAHWDHSCIATWHASSGRRVLMYQHCSPRSHWGKAWSSRLDASAPASNSTSTLLIHFFNKHAFKHIRMNGYLSLRCAVITWSLSGSFWIGSRRMSWRSFVSSELQWCRPIPTVQCWTRMNDTIVSKNSMACAGADLVCKMLRR